MDAQQARDVIATCYADKEMDINGRKYKFLSTTHKKRLSVYSYMTGIAPQLANGNMTFMDTPEWDRIEKIICELITFEDMTLSKLSNHWDKFPQDYLLFCTTAIQVISHPFLAGNPTS